MDAQGTTEGRPRSSLPPMAPPVPRARLPVLQPSTPPRACAPVATPAPLTVPARALGEAPRPAQDCARCRNIETCWDPILNTRQVALNLLTCRLERKIARNTATRMILKLLEPKVRKTAWRASQVLRMDFSEAMGEIQSVAIVSLLEDYVMGERAHPIHWLFAYPNGAVSRWMTARRRTADRDKRLIYYEHMPLSDEFYFHEKEATLISRANFADTEGRIRSTPSFLYEIPDEYDHHHEESERAQHLNATIDDGVTLNALEYRVLSFCLSNTDGTMNGLQLALADELGVSRSQVTRVYSEAIRKVLAASGYSNAYLAEREVPASRRRLFKGRRTELKVDEIVELLELRANKNLSMQDVAWMSGVSEKLARGVIRRFDGMSRDAIAEILHVAS